MFYMLMRVCLTGCMFAMCDPVSGRPLSDLMEGEMGTHGAYWNVGKCSKECSLVRLRPARPEYCGQGHAQYQSEPHGLILSSGSRVR